MLSLVFGCWKGHCGCKQDRWLCRWHGSVSSRLGILWYRHDRRKQGAQPSVQFHELQQRSAIQSLEGKKSWLVSVWWVQTKCSCARTSHREKQRSERRAANQLGKS